MIEACLLPFRDYELYLSPIFHSIEPHKRLNPCVDFFRLSLVYDNATDFTDNIVTDY